MDKDRLYEYRVIEEISRDETISQRDLAKELGLSVGLINAFVKRLIKKGYLKVSTIPRNRVRYLFTPRGIAEKGRLSLEYLSYSLNFYRHLRDRLTEVYGAIARDGGGRVVIWGRGEMAELACLHLSPNRLTGVAVVCDDPPNKTSFMGLPLCAPQDLMARDFDHVLIADVSDVSGVVDRLIGMGVSPERVHTLEGRPGGE